MIYPITSRGGLQEVLGRIFYIEADSVGNSKFIL